MKKLMITMTALASALVLLFPAAASADVGRTVVDPFEFYAIGHGDVGGLCLNDDDPTDPIPPEGAAFQSCATAVPLTTGEEDHVGVSVVDSAGQAVYFSIQQDNNPNFAWGCGTLSGGDLSADGLFPIVGSGPGGTAAEPVYVFPWAGPGINNVLDPGGSVCTGSVDTNIITPGTTGSATFTFHDHVA
jgi:hypothetical protein